MTRVPLVIAALVFLAGCGGTTVPPSARPASVEAGSPAATGSAVAPSATAGLPSPSAMSATGAPTATEPAASGSPEPAGPASRLVEHGDRTVPEVALTYDMGGRLGDALAIVRWLRDHGVHATVFLTGEASASATGSAILRIINARPDLFALGNHSWNHPDFTGLGAAAIRAQLSRTEAAMARWTSQSPRPLFRPPFGAWNDAVLAAVGAAGYSRAVTWDVDTLDWEPESDGGPTADAIVAKVLGGVDDGSIVLSHLGGYHTLAALPRIVAGLQARGYRLVTLREMAGVL